MQTTEKMPVLFIGHGSPDNAFEKNEFSENWKKLSALIPLPKAILCISAHWTTDSSQTKGAAVTAREKPETIHDFYGFPRKYYGFNYTAPGSPELAKKICANIDATNIATDQAWGLDHGAWSVLKNMYPKANIPVVQLRLDENLSPQTHWQIGKELAFLREEGVLILGSGNIVHNLRMLSAKTYPWATEFDEFIRTSLLEKNIEAILDYANHPAAQWAVPTDEHYLPLLYALGASENEAPQFFNEQIFAGAISMRCVIFSNKKISL